jgi:hypothetical protein|tara:strand:+ start:550 stop:942 length:393 start_codon:yes stop_codon:yes gene_type:complete
VLKIYVLIVVLGFVGGSVYGVWYYYKDTQQRIQILTENTAKLETAKKIQDATINTLIEDRDKFDGLNKELQAKLADANKYRDTLIDKLRKHDLVKLSLKKPGLVEKSINAGTDKLFRSIEVLSGAVPATK